MINELFDSICITWIDHWDIIVQYWQLVVVYHLFPGIRTIYPNSSASVLQSNSQLSMSCETDMLPYCTPVHQRHIVFGWHRWHSALLLGVDVFLEVVSFVQLTHVDYFPMVNFYAVLAPMVINISYMHYFQHHHVVYRDFSVWVIPRVRNLRGYMDISSKTVGCCSIGNGSVYLTFT